MVRPLTDRSAVTVGVPTQPIDTLTTAVVDCAAVVLRAASEASASHRDAAAPDDARAFAIAMCQVVVHLTETAQPGHNRNGSLRETRTALDAAKQLGEQLRDRLRGRTKLVTSVKALHGYLDELEGAVEALTSAGALEIDPIERLRRGDRAPAPVVPVPAETATKPQRRRPWWDAIDD